MAHVRNVSHLQPTPCICGPMASCQFQNYVCYKCYIFNIEPNIHPNNVTLFERECYVLNTVTAIVVSPSHDRCACASCPLICNRYATWNCCLSSRDLDAGYIPLHLRLSWSASWRRFGNSISKPVFYWGAVQK